VTAEYRIICVCRRADGHVRQIGYSERGNDVMYDDLWTIQQAREAIEQGHVLYILDPATGERSELELEDGGIGALDDLPPCG
jgi:hypothetical protein